MQQIELAGLHERAKPLIENVRAVCFSAQFGKAFSHETRMQPSQAANRHAIEMVNGSRRDRDFHGDSTIHCVLRCANRINLDVVIPARFEIRLEAPRNIVNARVGVRTLQQIHYLPAESVRAVNSLSCE